MTHESDPAQLVSAFLATARASVIVSKVHGGPTPPTPPTARAAREDHLAQRLLDAFEAGPEPIGKPRANSVRFLYCDWRPDLASGTWRRCPLNVSSAGWQPSSPHVLPFAGHASLLPWLHAQPDLCRGLDADALAARLWRRIRRSPQVRFARRGRWGLLPVSADESRLLHRLFGRGPGTLEQVLHVRRHHQALLTREREQTSLLPLLGLFPFDDRVWERDYSALRRAMCEAGLSAGGWKLLCRHGRRLWVGAIGTRRWDEAPICTVIVIANALAAGGASIPAPLGIIATFLDADGLVAEGEELTRMLPFRLLARATAAWQERGAKRERARFVAHELPSVVDWWHSVDMTDAAVPPRVRWSWYARAAAQWWAREAKVRRKGQMEWAEALAPANVDGYQIMQLCDALALWEEGVAMRSCLACESYLKTARQPTTAILSVREPGRHRPAATVRAGYLSLGEPPDAYGGRWYISEIRGPMNRAVDPAVQAAVERYLQNATVASLQEYPDPEVKETSVTARMGMIRPGSMGIELTCDEQGIVLEFDDSRMGPGPFLGFLRGVAVGAPEVRVEWETVHDMFEVSAIKQWSTCLFRVWRNEELFIECSVSSAALVAALYASMRAFVASPALPRDGNWSRMAAARLGWLLDARLNPEEIFERMACRLREANVDLMTRLICLAELTPYQIRETRIAMGGEMMPYLTPHPDADAMFSAGFDELPLVLRRDEVERALLLPLLDFPDMRWLGSEMIEGWLHEKGIDVEQRVRVANTINMEGEPIMPGHWKPLQAGGGEAPTLEPGLTDEPSEHRARPATVDSGEESALSELMNVPANPVDTEDGDEVEDDEAPWFDVVDGQACCPYCGSPDDCEHQLLSLDDTEGPLSGSLYDDCRDLRDAVKRWVFERLTGQGQAGSPKGALEIDAIDRLVGELGHFAGSWRMIAARAQSEDSDDDELDPEEAWSDFEDECLDVGLDRTVFAWIAEEMEGVPGVEWEMFCVDTAPGLSWHGTSYYAKDRKAAEAEFERRTWGRLRG
jgi:hypothetical protein